MATPINTFGTIDQNPIELERDFSLLVKYGK